MSEINTIPGFTPISLFPTMPSEGGYTFTDVCVRIVELALERHRGPAGDAPAARPTCPDDPAPAGPPRSAGPTDDAQAAHRIADPPDAHGPARLGRPVAGPGRRPPRDAARGRRPSTASPTPRPSRSETCASKAPRSPTPPPSSGRSRTSSGENLFGLRTGAARGRACATCRPSGAPMSASACRRASSSASRSARRSWSGGSGRGATSSMPTGACSRGWARTSPARRRGRAARRGGPAGDLGRAVGRRPARGRRPRCRHPPRVARAGRRRQRGRRA